MIPSDSGVEGTGLPFTLGDTGLLKPMPIIDPPPMEITAPTAPPQPDLCEDPKTEIERIVCELLQKYPFIGGAGGGQTSVINSLEVTFENEMIVSSVAGVQTYYIPIGNYLFDGAGETTLDLDTGGGYARQTFGVDYIHKGRGSVPATVADDGIGFTFIPAVAAGWTFRFRWKTRKLLVEPSPVAKIRVIGGVLQNAVKWNANSVNAPNGVRVPKLNGYQVEFWRQSRKNGGLSGTALPRGGRRYVPYFRGPINQFIFERAEFFPPPQSSSRRYFRVAYYNPVTHARSSLSQDIIVVCSDVAADGVNGRAPVRRQGSIWIE